MTTTQMIFGALAVGIAGYAIGSLIERGLDALGDVARLVAIAALVAAMGTTAVSWLWVDMGGHGISPPVLAGISVALLTMCAIGIAVARRRGGVDRDISDSHWPPRGKK
jgi:hypothetical protein